MTKIMFILGIILRILDLNEYVAFNYEKYECRKIIAERVRIRNGGYMDLGEEYLYRALSKKEMMVLTGICDFLVGYFLDDKNYFTLSSFFSDSYSSIENLVFLACLHGFSLPSEILLVINPYLICLSNITFLEKLTFFIKYIEIIDLKSLISHNPSLNALWFFYLNIFDQYFLYFHRIFFLAMLFLSSISSGDIHMKLTIFLFFNPSKYKHYLFLHLFTDKIKKKTIGSICYIMLCFVNLYINWLFLHLDIGNPNFINWINLIYVLMTMFDYNSELFIK